MVYGPPVQAAPLLKELEQRGARAVDPRAADTCGITVVHPSDEIDAEAAEAISLDLSRRYMSQDDYFELKAFSYYPRHYCRADFDADVMACDSARLPFRVSGSTSSQESKETFEVADAECRSARLSA
jgi:glutamate synthase domain-containing protein 1